MRLYFYNKNNLYDLFRFKKIPIDYNFTERFNITTEIVNSISNSEEFKIKNPKLKAIALTFLYKYIYENISGLIHILKLRNELNKETYVIKKGNPKFYRIEPIYEINLFSKDGALNYFLAFAGYYRLGMKKKDKFEYKDAIALIKRDNLSIRIWELINSKVYINNEIRDENYFGFLMKDYFTDDKIVKEAIKELQIFKKIMGLAFYLKLKYYLISGYKYFKLNPAKNFVTFEQHTISYMFLSYYAELININAVSIAHAVVNVDYKRHMAFDHCLLYGKSSEESFNRPDSIVCGKIIKTGAPIMNRMFVNIPKRDTFSNKVLFLTDYITDFGYDIEEVHIAKNALIKKLLNKFHEIKLTVKYHPAKINPYTKNILSDDRNIVFLQNVDIHTEIDNADVVICDGWSSSGLECAIRRKSLIVLNVKQERKDYYKYYESGFAQNALDENSIYNAFELIKNSNGAINEEARKSLIEYHLEYEDGITHTAEYLEKIIAA